MGSKYEGRRDEIVTACEGAVTFTEVEYLLGLTSPNGALRRYIRNEAIPIPHYMGQRQASAISQKSRRTYSLDDFRLGSGLTNATAKRLLLVNNIKTERCEICGWSEKRASNGKIPLELHHINGNSCDWRIVNLQLLCPNHHALTPNFRGANLNQNPGRYEQRSLRDEFYAQHICLYCGLPSRSNLYCSQECAHKAQRRIERPSKQQLIVMLADMTWIAIGRQFGVSDNTIRKWAKQYGILTKKNGGLSGNRTHDHDF